MRDVKVIIRCDNCKDPIDEKDNQAALDIKVSVDGRDYLVDMHELCFIDFTSYLDESRVVEKKRRKTKRTTAVVIKKAAAPTNGKVIQLQNKCKICGTTTATAAGLKTHESRMHNKKFPNSRKQA